SVTVKTWPGTLVPGALRVTFGMLTVLVAVDELLPVFVSVGLDAVAVLDSTVPSAVAAGTWTTMVKVALAPAAIVARLPVTVPFWPTGGLVKVKAGPDVCDSDTKVVPAGSASLSETVWASEGPALVTDSV